MTKGYKVFCNPINIMGYSDAELLILLEKINKVHPYAFSIVDTFGSMMENDLLRIYSLVEHNLDKAIKIGLHLHENLGLSYSLAQRFIGIKSSERECVIDASLCGMGRVPGNLNIELMMDYMNRFQGGYYNLSPVYDAINDYIEDLKSIEAWGYSTAYALSAKYNLHRNYSEYLLSKGKLRAKDINFILASIAESKKAAYDKDYIEQLYQKYQNVSVDDSKSKDAVKERLQGKKILVLGPGSSLITQRAIICQYIEENHPFIISVNFVGSDFCSDLAFFTSRRRYDQYRDELMTNLLVISSNLTNDVVDPFAIVDYYNLACDESGLYDNSMIMLLRLLSFIEIRDVTVAGFDGFDKSKPNYAYEKHYKDNKHTEDENCTISNYIEKFSSKMRIHFLTKTKYKR